MKTKTKIKLLIGLLLANACAVAGTGYITTIKNSSKFKVAHIKIVNLAHWWIYADKLEFDLLPESTYEFKNEERRWWSGEFAIYVNGFYSSESAAIGIQKWGTDPTQYSGVKRVITFNDSEHYVFTNNDYIEIKNDVPGSPQKSGYSQGDYSHYYNIIINDTPLSMDDFPRAKVKNTDFRDLLLDSPLCTDLYYDSEGVTLYATCVVPQKVMKKGYTEDADYTEINDLNYYKKCRKGDAILVDYTTGKLKCGS